MKIVSVTLARDSSETIHACLISALDSGLVDEAVVLDTGSTDDTKERAARFDPRVKVLSFAWPGDFAAARNTAFRMAHAATGATWGIMLDSDEVLVLDINAKSLRGLIEAGDVVRHCRDGSGSHTRERVYRLPLRGQFAGPTHETFVFQSGATSALLEGIRFSGKTKTAERMRSKHMRDAVLLESYVKEHPKDPRWTFYLADSLDALGESKRALGLFRAARAMAGWDEQRAYASFRAGQVSALLGDYYGAISDCITGLSLRADVAECAWLAAWAWAALENWEQVVVWARTCEVIVRELPQTRRVGFRFQKEGFFPQESYGPPELLMLAYARLGRTEEARKAQEELDRYRDAPLYEYQVKKTSSR